MRIRKAHLSPLVLREATAHVVAKRTCASVDIVGFSASRKSANVLSVSQVRNRRESLPPALFQNSEEPRQQNVLQLIAEAMLRQYLRSPIKGAQLNQQILEPTTLQKQAQVLRPPRRRASAYSDRLRQHLLYASTGWPRFHHV